MSGGRGVGGNREVSPLRKPKRPRRQSRHGLFSDIASDVALGARGDLRAAGAEAHPEEGGSWGKHGFPHEPQASDAHCGPISSTTTSTDAGSTSAIRVRYAATRSWTSRPSSGIDAPHS